MKDKLFVVSIICLVLILITTTLSLIYLRRDKVRGMLVFSINSVIVSVLALIFSVLRLLLQQ